MSKSILYFFVVPAFLLCITVSGLQNAYGYGYVYGYGSPSSCLGVETFPGTIQGFGGIKTLNQGDWGTQLRAQGAGGLQVYISPRNWPVDISLQWEYTQAKGTEYEAGIKVCTTGGTEEFSLGARYMWPKDATSRVHAYVSGGGSLIHAWLDGKTSTESVHDSDSKPGVWGAVGTDLDLYEGILLGVQVKKSYCKVELFEGDGDAGGLTTIGMLGYRW